MPMVRIWAATSAAIARELRVPGAVQHEVMRCRPGTFTHSEFGTVPVLQRTVRHSASKTRVNALMAHVALRRDKQTYSTTTLVPIFTRP